MRDPSLSDPDWQKKIRDRLTETVRAHRVHRPLFYNLGDEPGIADLSAFWDFDYSPRTRSPECGAGWNSATAASRR